MTFEEYLVSKKIDQGLFKDAEPKLFQEWKIEFEQVHPNSFTSQKLYLINPIRRKYILKQEPKSEAIAGNNVGGEKIISKEPSGTTTTATSVEESNSTAEQKPGSISDEKATPSPAVKPARPVFKPKPKMN
jgi:hypothetical protein